MINNHFPCDIGALVTLQEAIMKLRTIGLISTLALDKKSLSERDICTKFITPAIKEAGWNVETQVQG